MKKVKIINRDFSVLKEMESVNKWGMKTKITEISDNFDFIRIEEFFKVEIASEILVYVSKNYVLDNYIIERLAQYGFDITFQNITVIDTFEKLWQFAKENEIGLRPHYKIGRFYKSNCDNMFCCDKVRIEEVYNVKINLEL